MKLGALEAGGTKMVCAIGNEAGELEKRIEIPTLTPDKTIPDMLSFFQENEIEALGIGCFGPLNLDKKSERYGMITSTPKKAWRNYPIAGVFSQSLGVPVSLDTDVNAAALGEASWGAGTGASVVLYITVGTGVGVGVCIENKLLHGLIHPEAGHILITKQKNDFYEGACPFHKNCLEGLVSGPAIEARWGEKAVNLTGREEVWELEADYIAQALADFVLVYSPNKIILGGGVMHQKQLFPMIRERVKTYLNGYILHPMLDEKLNDYILPPGLGDNAGVKGALKLAMDRIYNR